MTVGAVLLALGALRPRSTSERTPAPTPAREAERVVYAVARPPAAVLARPVEPGRAVTPGTRAAPPRAGAAPAAGSPAPATSDTGGGVRTAPAPLLRPAPAGADPSRAAPARADAAGISAGGAVGLAPRPAPPVRFDSALWALRAELSAALAAGRLKPGAGVRRLVPPPLTQAERDSLGREATRAVAADAGHGTPVPRTAAGVSLGVGLPGGGPSRRRRERDRAVNAETMAIMARVQRRADSAVAARRRADSLAHVADSARGGSRPRR